MARLVMTTAAIAALLACPLRPGAAAAAVAPAPCAGAADQPTAATLQAAGDAVLCLINAERARRGIPRLRVAVQLTRAALAHSADMVKRRYFSHVTPAGLTPRRRAQRNGYVRRNGRAEVNETLATGLAELSTPAALVASLTDDAPHRRILLARRYRDVGVGLAFGSPIVALVNGVAQFTGATLTVDYGRR